MSKLRSSANGDIGRRMNSGESDDYDKASYGTTPTSASPPHSSSTMTESTSNSASNSSSSPPEPTTPPRANRSRTRYPDLGRVPLHRRGTSKKYEALEDLLKEAGYKETRIFTPESERSEAHRNVNGADDKRLSMRDGMGAVVGFFAGLIPSATASRTSLLPTAEESGPSFVTSPQEYSPPLSPLAQRYTQRNATRSSFESTEPSTPTNITSSIESLGDPTPKAAGRSNSPAPTITHPSYYQDHPPLIIRNASLGHQLRSQTSRNSLARPSNNNIVSPRPSRAGAYLRHMSSIQTMPERPNSTPVHLLARPRIQLNDDEPYVRRGNGEGEGDDEPPLPPSWLESVARAVLFGGNGAYVGGPANLDQPRHASGSASPRPPRVQVLRPTRSSLSQVSARRLRQPTSARSGLSDQTNTVRAAGGLLVPPPPLFSKIERGRAGRSEGEVTRARVTCRSAPGSRSASLVRGAADDAREKRKQRGREKRKKGDKDRVPSLARTHTEGDVWSRARAARRADAGAESESDAAGASSDEDEGELTLARILVPPKRQNSIKSLRKHLASESAGPSTSALKHIAAAVLPAGRSSVNVVSGGPPSVAPHRKVRRREEVRDMDLDGEVAQEWGAGWTRRGRAAHMSEDDDVEAYVGFVGADRTQFGSGRSSTGKRRTGLASAWGLAG